jgi:hypothetical protein
MRTEDLRSGAGQSGRAVAPSSTRHRGLSKKKQSRFANILQAKWRPINGGLGKCNWDMDSTFNCPDYLCLLKARIRSRCLDDAGCTG